ncbi:HlyD family secretion protein [Faecalibacter sp. LW9]|uniref:HlyD family secretion protein n=1 Tax=Faecalibacter sp. LW9 TaxID=3103144 RepID=UPI002AFF9983|nr:efflux RND transporter periplasmic adaptor subunit [Faecalibacter sp. LW9]
MGDPNDLDYDVMESENIVIENQSSDESLLQRKDILSVEKQKEIAEEAIRTAKAAKETAEKQLRVVQEQLNVAKAQLASTAKQAAATAKQIDTSKAQAEASKAQITVANSTIKQQQTNIENAKLYLSYTYIIAAEDGQISKVNLQPGQLVQAGQSLFNIVKTNGLWVVANYKETQLNEIREGQKAIIKVDAFPGHEFEATVTSISPATGAKFALLPPDNASGNFVKTVQRVPIKLVFSNPNDENDEIITSRDECRNRHFIKVRKI